MPEPKTVRVRIAVAIDKDGSWVAHGDSDILDVDAAQQAREVFLEHVPVEVVFIEADVLTQPQTIEGTVVP